MKKNNKPFKWLSDAYAGMCERAIPIVPRRARATSEEQILANAMVFRIQSTDHYSKYS